MEKAKMDLLIRQWNEATNKGELHDFLIKSTNDPKALKFHAEGVAEAFGENLEINTLFTESPKFFGRGWCEIPNTQCYAISIMRRKRNGVLGAFIRFSSGHKVEFSTFEEWQNYIKGDAFIQDFCEYYTNLANPQTTVQNGTGNE